MKESWARPGLLFVLGALALDAHARTDGQQAAAQVVERLRANDCPAAVERLNDGLKAGYPEIAMMAGSMFDVGVCVQKNWNKAVGFYSQASEGGIKEGAYRLAAGFAARENGPDMAAAMWWANRAGLQADRCTAMLPKADDPDRFVEELMQWPARELAVCNYVVGVIAFISAEGRYPIAGVKTEIDGRLKVTYRPGAAHFKTDPGYATFPARMKLNEVFGQAMRYAGARYPRPDGIDPAWEVRFNATVDTDKTLWW